MKGNRKESGLIIKWITRYCLTVVLFALAYCFIFHCNPTSFLISEQLNKRVARYDMLSTDFDLAEYHRDALDRMPLTVEGLSEMIDPALDDLGLINDSLSLLQQRLDYCENYLDSISSVVSNEREEVIETYITNALNSYVDRIDSLKALMAGEDSISLIVSGRVEELARLKIEKATKERDVLNYINRNYQAFIPVNQIDTFLYYANERIRLRSNVQNLKIERDKQVTNIRGIVNRFHNNRISSVGFLEFLYYSICVSTTVSFGDISPNNGLTRFLAIVELLWCIVIVGFILDGVIRRKGETLNCSNVDMIEPPMENEENKSCLLKLLWSRIVFFVKSKVLLWLFLIALIPIIVYVWHFHGLKLSDNPADWGVFGDYIGGVYSVLIAILVVYISRHLDIRDEETKRKQEAVRKIHNQISSIRQNQKVNPQKLTKLFRLIDESKLYINGDLYTDLVKLANHYGEKGRNRSMEMEVMDALKDEYAEK